MIQKVVKKPFKIARNGLINWQTERYLHDLQKHTPIGGFEEFDYYLFKERVVKYINSMRDGGSPVQFRYSASSTRSTLYASVYACMTYSLLGELGYKSLVDKQQWVAYFDSFQKPEDGLFYDPVVNNDLYNDTDWWGARHLALHMIVAYTDLGARPKNTFKFLEKYYDLSFVNDWLNKFDWMSAEIGAGDIDNELMNIGCLLQYSRDEWGDERAGDSVDFIKRYLIKKINPNTGMWGGFDVTDQYQRSRMIQFAYHLFPLFFYDDYFDFNIDSVVDLTLKTQNQLGGFGVKFNSSACEDIDSIDLLIRLLPYVDENRKGAIYQSIDSAWRWVLCNQVKDGGFVFRLNEKMQYGHPQMSVDRNHGALFPTWFRVLSMAYIYNIKRPPIFVINKTPGLVY